MHEADLRHKLEGDRDLALWRDLRRHAAYDRLFLVTGEADLVDIGVALALDDAAKVGAWIAAGVLARPSPAQLETWERDLERPFDSLIVSPFVLIRAHADA